MTRRMIHRSLPFLILALLAVACIKRQPLPVEPEAADAEHPTVATAAAAPTEPTGNYGKVPGVDLLEGEGVSAFKLGGETQKVKLTTVPVKGQDFDEAVRADIKQASTNIWDVQLAAKIPGSVERGDILLATFHFRTDWSKDESGEGETEFAFELGEDPWTKSSVHGVRASNEWIKVLVPFKSEGDYGPGKAQAVFRLGYPPQRIEIGGVKIENFEKKLALADLPRADITYHGRAEDAPWRAAAAQRIEKVRKGELEVVVQDGAGRPVPGAQVHVELTRHAFSFGTCAPASRVLDAKDPKFVEVLAEHFNLVTLENDLKWAPLAGDWGPGFTVERAQQAADALKSRGIPVRGHVLVWPSWENLPRALQSHANNKAKLKSEVEQHVAELTAAMKGRVAHWDVVNEPFDNHDLTDLLGQQSLVDWFKGARAADADAKLYINDYAILSGGGGSSAHRDHYAKTIRKLLDAGAPLDGIGMQGHFGTTLTAPEALVKTLDRFAKLGKPILVTEFDVPALGEELAAHYLRDFYTVMFSHPSVEGVVMWGFWDGSHWKNNAPLYRKDWSLKPAGEAFKRLVQEEWHTDETGQTGAGGAFKTRAFLGDYVVKASLGERQAEVQGTLVREGTRLIVKL